MKLDARQTRRLLLSGSVPFPKPFPSTGGISIESIKLVYSKSAQKQKSFIVVQEHHKCAVTRLILQSGVAAIFFPGSWVKVPGVGRVFRFSHRHAVHDFERGEWFLGPEISVDAIRTRLRKPKLAIHKRGNPARGVVFVYKSRPVMSITETVQSAGSIGPQRTEEYCCDPYRCCDCCDYGCCDCDERRLFTAERAFASPSECCGFDTPQGCDPCDC